MNIKEKASKLVSEMTVEEVISQLSFSAPEIARLGIPSYNWWSDALHGVARSGTATVFPQAIGLASAFDEALMLEVGEICAIEARAKYNMQEAKGDRGIYKGLTLWSPNINIFRDPRWGRGHETYGEDPYLTASLGVAFIRGLQGSGKFLKTAACAKHYAAHSGPEHLRHSFNAVVSDKDLYETYLPAFEAAVKEGNVESIMGAYNRLNGEPCCGSEFLLTEILRDEWGFEGHVVSDCGAIHDINMYHLVTETLEESVALALNSGCDLNCTGAYEATVEAYKDGLLSEDVVRQAAERLFETRYKLGIMDERSTFDNIPYSVVNCEQHKSISLKAAEKTAVLLKNNGLLPLSLEKIKTIAVIGPNATSIEVLKGNYCGTDSEFITNLQGIQEISKGHCRVLYSAGCHLFKDSVEVLAGPGDRLSEAETCAELSDVVVLSLGLDATLEGEQGDASNSYAAGDKQDLYLPRPQRELLRKVLDVGTPVILILNSGSPIDLDGEDNRCAAVLQAWYSGAQGGRALANLLFGREVPSGRLPISFVKEGSLPDFHNYSMKGRTYRYQDKAVIYPFGYGLSYTKFVYSNLAVNTDGENIMIKIAVTNNGSLTADEIIQIYARADINSITTNSLNSDYLHYYDKENQPFFSLCGTKRVRILGGEKKMVELSVSKKHLMSVLDSGEKVLLKGIYTLFVGGSQPDNRSKELLGAAPISAAVIIE